MPIILVENDEAIRLVLARSMRKAGYEVDEAVDGSSACRILNPKHHRLVVSDIVYPGFDGFMAAAAGRYPIILMSGYTRNTPMVEEVMRTVKPAEFLEKPFGGNRLVDAVDMHYMMWV